MGLGSGLSSQLGFSAESAYGTYVAPTKFIPVSQFEVKRRSHRVQGEGIRVGGLAPLGSLHGETHNDAMGTASFEMINRGLGVLFKALMGGAPAPAQVGGTSAYETTFALGDTSGVSLSMQGGVPFAAPGGAVRPYTLLGGKVLSMEFSCRVGELLRAQISLDGKSFTTSETLATASFPTGLKPFTFQQATVKAGTYESEVAISGVKGFSIRVDRPHDTERFYLGGGALKTEPALNAFARVSGTLDMDYLDDTFVDHVANATSPSLVIEFVGAEIESGNYDTFRVTIPQAQVTDGNPSVSGTGTVSSSFTFEATDDGTNPAATIYTVNEDTAL